MRDDNKRALPRRQIPLLLAVVSLLAIEPTVAYKKGFHPDANQHASSGDLQITVYPHELTVREGKDATFECRARAADNSAYPNVRWTRVGGRLPDGAHESSGGRLTLHPVQHTDSGRYACVAMHGGRTVEAYAVLHVQSYGPQEFQSGGTLQDGAAAGCMADEKACASNQCVKADYVCDGEPDCADRSDEQNCPNKRHCEPNEFRCANDRCIQKMWLCDGDDDCGDSSDERNCGERKPGDVCQPTEFRCSDGQQCVPQSFQCDGTNDCRDGSDEVGCVQPTIVQAPDSNKVVPTGGDFKLTCRAVAVPEPYINWRLNWGPVCEPPRCQQQSEGGVGTLTVKSAEPLDQGAYTCEAINVKGRVLATPDCIVRIVSIPAPPPPPPVQRPQTCHPQGAVAPVADSRGQCQCKPNAAGPTCSQCSPGSFNMNDRAPQGCMRCFCFGVSHQCQSSHLFRTKEKLAFHGDAQGVALSTIDGVERAGGAFDLERYGFLAHKEPHDETLYWKLPSSYLGDKVTSYGGQLAFQLEYNGGGSTLNTQPLVVIKGNGITLVHRSREHEGRFVAGQPFPHQIPTYEFSYEHLSGGPATHEDLLTVLADVDTFLIRATHADDQQSTSIGEVSWETAVPHDTQDVRALEVEQCACPPGYQGTSCEDCAPGYERSGQGPYLGTCVPRRAPPAPTCSAVGAVSAQPLQGDRCVCKQNTVGATCDQCAPGSFNLAPSNPQGCSKCFCSGVTNQCQSSGLHRSTVELDYSRGAQEVLRLGTQDARAPFSPSAQATVLDGALNFDALHEARGESLYWHLPVQFQGDQITAYGGKLTFTHRAADSESGRSAAEPTVIIRGNDITLHHTARVSPVSPQDSVVEVPISEESWQRADGHPATREHLLMALADVSDVLVKAGAAEEADGAARAALIRVALDRAVPSHEAPSGSRALEVEECACPVGYVGTSCEDCAPGYSRTGGGLYLGLCQKCDCNGHASECDAEYGACVNCQHNTEGDQCERCRPGYVGDARGGTPHDCQRAPEREQARPPCQCYNHSPRGCDSFGRCLLCEHNTEGYHCETCKKGYYGDATKATPYDCTPCPCPGASDCFLDQGGQVQCRNCPAGFAGRLCDECAPGYTRSQTSGGRDCEPIGRVRDEIIQFVPEPEVSLRVEILPPKHLSITEGNRVKWTCKASEQFKPEEVEIGWSKIGHVGLPPSVRQHGHQLVIDSATAADAGEYRCTGTHRDQVATDDARLQVQPHQRRPTPQPAAQTNLPKPVVEPPYQRVDENQQAVFTCLTPGFADCEVEWHFNSVGGALPPGVFKRGNQVFIPTVQQQHAGNYICTVFHQLGRAESNPGQLEINRAQLRPMVDPPEHNVEAGDPARFRCWVPGVPDAVLNWRPANGGPLPHGAEQQAGYLNFPRADHPHSGQYVCAAHDPQRDPHGSTPVDSEPVRLNVRQDAEIVQPPQVDPPHQTVNIGQPARFRCWVPGQPNAQLRWTPYHGGQLPAGAREENAGGLLHFPAVADADAGAYVCIVHDPQTGRDTPSAPVRLLVEQPRKPMVDPPEQTVTAGDPSRIRCWLPGGSGVERLQWQRHGGGTLPDGAHDDGRGVLTIARTAGEHQGDYECVAHDPNRPESGPQTSDPARIRLQYLLAEPKVQIPSDESTTGNPPNPIATPAEQTVRRGEPARFHCDARSQSPAEIHWEVRDGAVQHGDELVIHAADDAHVGSYVCTATNAYGQRQASPVVLHVTDGDTPPTARVSPKVWNAKPGDHQQIRCHVAGSPTPTIAWRGPAADGRLPAGVVDLGDGVLEISDAKREHEGGYTCTATNRAGEASDFGSVNVGDLLTVRTDPAGPKLVFTVGEPVKIRCEAFGDPDPSVEWLHDPGPERGDLPDDYVPITITEQFITHPSIGLGNAGRYTCKGSNRFASVTKDIYIEVVEPSHLATVAVLGGAHQWFPPGQPAQLVCASSGAELVERLEWTRAGGGSVEDLGEQNEPGVLHFDTFKASDEGDYECHAYRKDEKIATTKVTVSSDANLSADAVNVEISPPTVRVVNKGDSIVLDCVVHGRSTDEFTYAWSLARGGSLVRQASKDSQLVVKDAEPSNDYGIYRCEVENTDGDAAGSAQVAVAVGFDAAASPQEAKFDEESEAVLTCPVFVVPGATVTWSRQHDELPENHQIRGHQLVIESFDDSASGVYTCTVQYGQSTVEGFINAKIFVPDTTIKVVLNASAESVQVGERAWLDCIVVGDANAKIEFSKEDADALPANAQVTGHRLLFTAISEENSGKYKCRATTSEGPLETSALLNVESAKHTVTVQSSLDDTVSTQAPLPLSRPLENIVFATPSAVSTQIDVTPTRLPYVSPSVLEVTQTVGQSTVIACNVPRELRSRKILRVGWTRAAGRPMPRGYRIDGEHLILPRVQRDSAGDYKCVLEFVSGGEFTSLVQLTVHDYIPQFDGHTVLNVSPLSEELWDRLDLDMAVMSDADNGVIFHATKQSTVEESRTPTVFFHTISLNEGKLRYSYNVGGGEKIMETPYRMQPKQWFHLHVENSPNNAIIHVNNEEGIAVSNQVFLSGQDHLDDDEGEEEYGSGGESIAYAAYLGGSEPMDENVRTVDAMSSFRGSIGRVFIANKSVDLSLFFTQNDVSLSMTDCNDGQCDEPSKAPKAIADRLPLKQLDAHEPRRTTVHLADDSRDMERYPTVTVTPESDEEPSAPLQNDLYEIVTVPTSTVRTTPKLNEYSRRPQPTLTVSDRDKSVDLIDESDDILLETVSPMVEGITVYPTVLTTNSPAIFTEPLEDTVETVPRTIPFTTTTTTSTTITITTTTTVAPLGYGSEEDSAELTMMTLPDETLPDEISLLSESDPTIQIQPGTDVPTTQLYETNYDRIPTTNLSIPTTNLSETLTLEAGRKLADALETPFEHFEPFAGLCTPTMCGDHGTCATVNTTHVFCHCRDYFVGATCQEFHPIEHAARFDGSAFIVFSADEFPHFTSEQEESIAMRLKTKATDGVIFWQGQRPESNMIGEDYVSIGLEDGYLIFTYELGGGAATVKSAERINNGRVHRIEAIRRGRNGTLLVDQRPATYGMSSGILAMLNVEGNLYIGGLPHLEQMSLGIHTKNFVGCIADITINRSAMDIMASTVDGRNVRPCYGWRYRLPRRRRTKAMIYDND